MLFQHALPVLSLIGLAIAHPMSDAADATSANPTIIPRGSPVSDYPWITQYNVSDCTSGAILDRNLWPDINTGAGVVHNLIVQPRLYIHPHSAKSKHCMAWYPVVNQQQGPGVGVSFGTNNESISQLQIFQETPECVAAFDHGTSAWGFAPLECCDEASGLLGVINANGTGEAFGAKMDLGIKGGACVNVGKDGDQNFWTMRYLKAVV